MLVPITGQNAICLLEEVGVGAPGRHFCLGYLGAGAQLPLSWAEETQCPVQIAEMDEQTEHLVARQLGAAWKCSAWSSSGTVVKN